MLKLSNTMKVIPMGEPEPITIQSESGRVVTLPLATLDAFEAATGYWVEDVVPDFMLHEILQFIRNND
jgi:hypothetical protein